VAEVLKVLNEQRTLCIAVIGEIVRTAKARISDRSVAEPLAIKIKPGLLV